MKHCDASLQKVFSIQRMICFALILRDGSGECRTAMGEDCLLEQRRCSRETCCVILLDILQEFHIKLHGSFDQQRGVSCSEDFCEI